MPRSLCEPAEPCVLFVEVLVPSRSLITKLLKKFTPLLVIAEGVVVNKVPPTLNVANKGA